MRPDFNLTTGDSQWIQGSCHCGSLASTFDEVAVLLVNQLPPSSCVGTSEVDMTWIIEQTLVTLPYSNQNLPCVFALLRSISWIPCKTFTKPMKMKFRFEILSLFNVINHIEVCVPKKRNYQRSIIFMKKIDLIFSLHHIDFLCIMPQKATTRITRWHAVAQLWNNAGPPTVCDAVPTLFQLKPFKLLTMDIIRNIFFWRLLKHGSRPT